MSPYFKSYVSNLNRVRLAELIDHHIARVRHAKVRLSIVNNSPRNLPRTGNDCETPATETDTQASLTTLP
ncbi:hypothetical protein [Hyphomicrobium sp. ghe19]|uniref:hypothetical protein n=1 Tax=Hyphomicrobium sp. ghe19 TaxID=2682968 RepID=UPI00136765A9|nr:hypothetical protein HYPP_02252 [Hyphomicrobium sp. ghe19]